MPLPTRRSVLAGALAAAPLSAAPFACARAAVPFPVGLQLWTVKDELDRDFDGALHRVAQLGFKRLETAGLHGRSPEAFRAAVERAGMRCEGAHVAMGDLDRDLPGQVAQAKALGVRWLVCSSPAPGRPPAAGQPWMQGMREALTPADWPRIARTLDRFGEAAHGAGLRLAYHTHAFDFVDYGGRPAIETVLGSTHPERVKLELDCAWAVAGGADPVEVIRAHPGRVRLLHLKGLKARTPPGAPFADATCPVGSGVIDWPPILRAARSAGVEEAFVEQEPPFTTPVFGQLAQSLAYLRAVKV